MTAHDYRDRLTLPLDGDPTVPLSTRTGFLVATGYLRIVVGDRGPYVEFDRSQIAPNAIAVPEDAAWRRKKPYADRVFYVEWRTVDAAAVKIYDQLRRVEYADYVPGRMYASPADLFHDGRPVLPPRTAKARHDPAQGTLFAPPR